jgi:hypothetical protein
MEEVIRSDANISKGLNPRIWHDDTHLPVVGSLAPLHVKELVKEDGH